jgi:hypothetical protein
MYQLALQVSWVYADIDGDGQDDFIAGDSPVDPNVPVTAYRLFGETTSAPIDPQKSGPHFYLGGKRYDNWESVPREMKVPRKRTPNENSLMGDGSY